MTLSEVKETLNSLKSIRIAWDEHHGRLAELCGSVESEDSCTVAAFSLVQRATEAKGWLDMFILALTKLEQDLLTASHLFEDTPPPGEATS